MLIVGSNQAIEISVFNVPIPLRCVCTAMERKEVL